MTTKQRHQFNRMRQALTKIYKYYQTPAQLLRNCEKDYGLGYQESLEMAYENLQSEARSAVKGVKEMKPPKPKEPKKAKAMAPVITIALLLSAIFSYGQTLDRAHTLPFYAQAGYRLPTVDTEAVYFLVADTAHRVRVSSFIAFDSTMHGRGLSLGKLMHDTTDFGIQNNASFIVKGFIAREQRADQWNESFWMEPVAYLDAYKKPLPKTYIIWQTKPRLCADPPTTYTTAGRLVDALDSIEKILPKTKRKP